MKLIVTLGNPDDKYHFTRHNFGFMYADFLANNLNFDFTFEKKFKAKIAKISVNKNQVLIVKPQTYMNLSGEAVRLIMDFYKISIGDLLVIYDDISLNLGTIRFKDKGSDGGHNGIKSIIQHLKTKTFDRLKLGIGPQPQFIMSEDFVLQNFTKEQLIEVKKILKITDEAIHFYFENDIFKAQNKFN